MCRREAQTLGQSANATIQTPDGCMLFEAISAEAHMLLSKVDVDNIARMVRLVTPFLRPHLTLSQTDARVMTELLTYVRHLRSIIHRAPLDYSAIQVFVKWIVQRSTAHSPSHNAIHICARSLEEIVSLRSGLLLVEMWASLASLRPSDTSRNQVDRLARAGNQVSLPSYCLSGPSDSTVDFSTSSSRILELMSLWTLPAERSAADNEHLIRVTDMIVRVSFALCIEKYWLTRNAEGTTRPL